MGIQLGIQLKQKYKDKITDTPEQRHVFLFELE